MQRKTGKTSGSKGKAGASATYESKDSRIREQMSMAVSYLQSLMPSDAEIAHAAANAPSLVMFSCHPPSKDAANGGRPIYPSMKTHFTAFKDGALQDAKTGGVPWVSLLQGFQTDHIDGRRRPDPRTLPGSLTAVDLLNRWILKQYPDPDDAPCFRLVFRGKERQNGELVQVNRLELHLVWDSDGWDELYAPRTRREREPAAPAPSQAPVKEMTVDEWKQVEAARRAKLAATLASQ